MTLTVRIPIIVALSLGLSAGCTIFRNPCKTPGAAYNEAKESAPLSAPTGLSVPEQDPNLTIPDARGVRVPYASKVDDPHRPGKTRVQCLSEPPPIRGGS